MKHVLVLTFLFAMFIGGVKAQEHPRRIYFSDSLNQVLLYHGDGLNLSNPELWITVLPGATKHGDTIAMARDSAFVVTHNGFHPRKPCRHFKDQKGRSFYCILAAYSKSAFLSRFGYSDANVRIDSSQRIVFEVGERHIERHSGECERPHDVLTGNVISILKRENEQLTINETWFDYDVEKGEGSTRYSNDLILKSIESEGPPYIYSSSNLEYTGATYRFESSRGNSYYKDENGDCERILVIMEGSVRIEYLRIKK